MSLFSFNQGGITIYFLVYVDDIIVVSSDAAAVDKLLDKLRSDFALKDLGSLHYFLGIKVSTLSSGLLLTQRKYAQELILKASLKDCKATPTPLSISENFALNVGEPLDADSVTG